MIDIVDNQDFHALCGKLQGQPYIVLDTEFIRERTYYPVLALLQIAWRGQAPILADPLKIDDWEPFHEVLRNPSIRKVLHAGRQDVEIFFYQMNAMPENLFDTQIAAAMCGFGDQIGYSALVSKLLGVQLAKGSSYTNWLQRPLTKAQLRYAREDVEYLPDLYERLVKEANALERLQWIDEEMREQFRETLFDPDPENLWQRVKKARSLKPRDLAVLRELTRWRDETARRINKPVRFLLPDEVMVELSKIDALTLENLHSRRNLQGGFIDRFGQEIMARHQAGRATPRDQWPRLQRDRERPPSEKSEVLADLAWLLIKEIARNAAIAPTNLVAKKNLAAFIEAYVRKKDLSKFDFFHGWRKEMIGEPLVKLIEGKLSIKVDRQKIIWQDTTD